MEQGLASRYSIMEEGSSRQLVCESTPNMSVLLDRGVTIDREQARREYPKQSIFLDGYCSGLPFLDNEYRQYSFDHHSPLCPRPFLLATCEQAVVMVLSGMPLEDGHWRVFINDADLDALLAAWVLVNHPLLRQNRAKVVLDIMPLIRVEGVIDAHGTQMSSLSGLPPYLWERYQRDIEELRVEEVDLKAAEAWESTDLVGHAKDMFDKLDARLVPPRDLEAIGAIKESGRVSVVGNKVAVFCKAKQGIYAVEERLKERFGNQLGIVVLDGGNGRITLRQVDSFLPKDLTDLYAALNREDPNAQPGDRWGGAADIGGSPRRSGTGLSSDRILSLVAEVFGEKKGWWRKLWPPRAQ